MDGKDGGRKDRCQKSDVRCQKDKSKGQRTEVGRQMADVGKGKGQRSEDLGMIG